MKGFLKFITDYEFSNLEVMVGIALTLPMLNAARDVLKPEPWSVKVFLIWAIVFVVAAVFQSVAAAISETIRDKFVTPKKEG